MLKAYQKIILLLVLISGISLASLYAKSDSQQTPNDTPRIWLLKAYMTGGFGIYVNDTIYQVLQDTTGVLADGAANNLATVLWPPIFSKMKFVTPAILNDAYLTKTNNTSPIYLINPTLKNKWVMQNTSNAYFYGFDLNKALLVNQAFLDQFPTAYYF